MNLGGTPIPTFVAFATPRDTKSRGWLTRGGQASYDSNSQVPCGEHNGRQIFYVFGRYPDKPDGNRYPVLDLVICHCSFLNADNS